MAKENETVEITPRVELYVVVGEAPTWVDVSEDVVSAVQAAWGIHGAAPDQRLADPGSMRFQLDNSNRNSGGLAGYYTLGHVNCREGFTIRTPARLSFKNDLLGTKVIWLGTVEDAVPVVGTPEVVTVSCVDWLEDAARSKLSGLAVETDIQSDALFDVIMAAAPKQPPGGTRAGTGSDVYPFALDNVQDEKTTVIEALDLLMRSEYGIGHTTAGVMVFEGRRSRGGGGSIRLALDESTNLVSLDLANGRDEILNRVQVLVHPRRVDSGPVVLFNLGSSIEIPRGTSIVVNCPYRDQNQQAQRVGGISMETPDAGEGDYAFNAVADGSGKDITEQLEVTAVFGGNSAQVTLTNHGPADGFVPPNGLKLRGIGLYDFEPVVSDVSDVDSIDAYGEGVFTYDMALQSSPTNAADLARFLLAMHKNPNVRPARASFIAQWSYVEAEAAYNLAISDRVSVTAAVANLSAVPCFINGFTVNCSTSGLITVTLDLAPTDTAQYWQLDVDGRTEMDNTTILGYGLFVAGWILDTSALGDESFLN